MGLSRRLRFEIFRRDNHQCRYCGATAPDVPLRVDHVIPEALGGKTEPSATHHHLEDVMTDGMRLSRAEQRHQWEVWRLLQPITAAEAVYLAAQGVDPRLPSASDQLAQLRADRRPQ